MDKWEKEYREVMRKIEVPEELKRKTMNQVHRKPEGMWMGKWILAVGSILLIVNVLLGADILMRKQQIQENKEEVMAETKIPLKTVGSFENLQTLAQSVGVKEIEKMKENNKQEAVLDESISYSQTNVQEKGVDEEDIVKTDGKYIYQVTEGKIVIHEIKGEQTQMISKIVPSNEWISGIYLKENILVAICNGMQNECVAIDTREEKIFSRRYTKIILYSILDRNSPVEMRKIEIEGNYITSRLIEGNLYLVAQQRLETGDILKEGVNPEELKLQYKDSIESSECKRIGYDQIYQLSAVESLTYTSIVGFNIHKEEKAEVFTFLGAEDTLYCSQDNLYLVGQDVSGNKWKTIHSMYEVNSKIYRFALQNTKIQYKGEVELPGYVLNQFSMGEKDGIFRVAMMNLKEEGNADSRCSNIYLLDETMDVIGKLEGIAEGENLYAARFVEDTCYLVTFKEIDPFFVIDLSNVKEPKLLGELKIEGFSTYLQNYDKNHVIGIGNQVKQTRTGMIEDGIKITMFDTTIGEKPKEMFSTIIGSLGTYSQALYNHKSVLLIPEKNLLSFPITIREGKEEFEGAVVYEIQMEGQIPQFVEKARITHQDKKWNYQKVIERVLLIENNIVTVSEGMIKVTPL